MALALGQSEPAPVHRKSCELPRQTQAAASLIACHLSGISGVSRFSVIVKRSISYATKQRRRSRNRYWQLLFCRFLRGQRRLDLQLWLPIPVETSAPPLLCNKILYLLNKKARAMCCKSAKVAPLGIPGEIDAAGKVFPCLHWPAFRSQVEDWLRHPRERFGC